MRKKRMSGVVVLCCLLIGIGAIADTWTWSGSGTVIIEQTADWFDIQFSLQQAYAFFGIEGPVFTNISEMMGEEINGTFDIDAFALDFEVLILGQGSEAEIMSEWPNLESLAGLIGEGFHLITFEGEMLDLSWENDLSALEEMAGLGKQEDNTHLYIVINAQSFLVRITNNLKKPKGPELKFISLAMHPWGGRVIVKNVGDSPVSGVATNTVTPSYLPWYWHGFSGLTFYRQTLNPTVIQPGEYGVFDFRIPKEIPDRVLEELEETRQYYLDKVDEFPHLAKIMAGSSFFFTLTIEEETVYFWSPPLKFNGGDGDD